MENIYTIQLTVLVYFFAMSIYYYTKDRYIKVDKQFFYMLITTSVMLITFLIHAIILIIL